MKMDNLWEESLGHRLKAERNLNFSTISNEEDDFGFSRKKTARDPMSHRIIEKRRRDRMNNCLADLSRLVPTNYLKKGRGRIEKTEIIEMAIKHLKHLQAHPCKDPATCEVAKATEQDHKRQYRLGFQECMSETVRFLVEIEGLYAGDGLCVRLVSHLQKHYDKVAGGMCYTQALGMMTAEENKILPMDVEHSSTHSFATDNYSDVVTSNELHQMNHIVESRLPDIASGSDNLKKENSVNIINGNFHEPTESVHGPETSSVNGASQLREMLQNPGLPKEPTRSNVITTPSSQQHHHPQQQENYVVSSANINGHADHPPAIHASKNDEVYKFKNNIKHRFNADLRHHTSSPTDSQSDRNSLPDEERTHHDARQYVPNSDEAFGTSVVCYNGSANTQGYHPHYTSYAGHQVSELTVKIPERTLTESTTHPNHWDSHGETGSSCGSNPSTPPVARSNGSSSGYSTNGEIAQGSKLKPTPNTQSPAVSPYSRTPDHLLNRSPSPQHHPTPGVPIFALHPKGTFYIPLTIDATVLTPYFIGIDELAPVLHPVSICVNFSFCRSLKTDKLNGSTFHFRSQPFFTDRFNNDRYPYGERHQFFPCSPVHN